MAVLAPDYLLYAEHPPPPFTVGNTDTFHGISHLDARQRPISRQTQYEFEWEFVCPTEDPAKFGFASPGRSRDRLDTQDVFGRE